MAHVKRQAREAATALLTGLPTTGSRVFPGKRLPWDSNSTPSQMPGLALYLDAETVGPMGKDRRQRRDMLLIVEMAGRVQSDLALDDLLLTMEAEVEAALMADPTFGGLLAQPLALIRVSPPPPDTALGDAYMVRRHEYALVIFTEAADPTQAAT